MSLFTQEELAVRQSILQTHKIFGNYLNIHVIRRLINLFDNKHNIYNPVKIDKYIKDKRISKGYNNSNIIIKHEVYGLNKEDERKDNPTLYLGIFKDGIEIIHLSIHLTMKGLEAKGAGTIHIYKDIYDKNKLGGLKKKLYSLISVSIPVGKPNSLEFNIADGLTTPFMPDYQTYDPQIQQEMDVIITILNRIFNEDDKIYYIGNEIFPIHNKTNIILAHINRHNLYFTRKNRGVSAEPMLNNQSPFINITSRRKTSKNTKRITRKSAVGSQPYIPDRT